MHQFPALIPVSKRWSRMSPQMLFFPVGQTKLFFETVRRLCGFPILGPFRRRTLYSSRVSIECAELRIGISITRPGHIHESRLPQGITQCSLAIYKPVPVPVENGVYFLDACASSYRPSGKMLKTWSRQSQPAARPQDTQTLGQHSPTCISLQMLDNFLRENKVDRVVWQRQRLRQIHVDIGTRRYVCSQPTIKQDASSSQVDNFRMCRCEPATQIRTRNHRAYDSPEAKPMTTRITAYCVSNAIALRVIG